MGFVGGQKVEDEAVDFFGGDAVVELGAEGGENFVLELGIGAGAGKRATDFLFVEGLEVAGGLKNLDHWE